ncbi:DNA repair protein rad2 [Dimargaris cristalligena]|nr:DNA repair protein rad2 [Dimargaris cristalligena]
MGVQGLWPLLEPAARPTKLESLRGRRLAIDASIWLHQFIKAIKDKEGNALPNSHILGFLRRICKLLYYGIKPVFVFDGQTPEIKRKTIAGRQQRREKLKDGSRRAAEKILSAQLKLRALQATQSPPKSTDHGASTVTLLGRGSPGSKRKRDPYDLSLGESSTSIASSSTAQLSSREDPRLALKGELEVFVEENQDAVVDMDSEVFKALPLEIQHEIVLDLKNRSRQTSWDRFEEMVRLAPTAFEFSQLQIKNLVKRNDLMQKYLTVSGMDHRVASLKPGRVAGERSREYVLVRNDEAQGGWTMGAARSADKVNSASSDRRREPEVVTVSDCSTEEEEDEFEEVHIPEVPLGPLTPDAPGLPNTPSFSHNAFMKQSEAPVRSQPVQTGDIIEEEKSSEILLTTVDSEPTPDPDSSPDLDDPVAILNTIINRNKGAVDTTPPGPSPPEPVESTWAAIFRTSILKPIDFEKSPSTTAQDELSPVADSDTTVAKPTEAGPVMDPTPDQSTPPKEHVPEISASPLLPPARPVFKPSGPPQTTAVEPTTESDEKRQERKAFLTSLEHNSPAQVRQHLHSEITQFRQRQTREERYASEVNAEMVSDIQLLLRLFGIPFTTAPTEAEAECAQLSQQGLIDGIVTDDSDVFLFGGTQVFRHMFNQAKSVEYYLLADLGQEMAIDRTILIQLAYLLGSDYTDGIPGVGLVNALEILNEFRGPAALADFKTWWLNATNPLLPSESHRPPTAGLERLRKLAPKIHLPDTFPDPQVRDAYGHPIVSQDATAFQWGFPDLDALRDYLGPRLRWPQSKVDQVLLPVLRRCFREDSDGPVGAAPRAVTVTSADRSLLSFFTPLPASSVSRGSQGQLGGLSTTGHKSERVRCIIAQWKAAATKPPTLTSTTASEAVQEPSNTASLSPKANQNVPVPDKPTTEALMYASDYSTPSDSGDERGAKVPLPRVAPKRSQGKTRGTRRTATPKTTAATTKQPSRRPKK